SRALPNTDRRRNWDQTPASEALTQTGSKQQTTFSTNSTDVNRSLTRAFFVLSNYRFQPKRSAVKWHRLDASPSALSVVGFSHGPWFGDRFQARVSWIYRRLLRYFS